MLKKITFIIKSLKGGGAEKVLINLLKLLPKEINLELIVIFREGELLSQLPEGITVKYLIEPKNRVDRIIGYLKLIVLRKYIYSVIFQNSSGEILISFLEGWSDFFLHSIKDNNIKFSWLHSNSKLYSPINPARVFFKLHAKKSKKVFCVSNGIERHLLKHRPIFEGKTEVCYNPIDFATIKEKSEKTVKLERSQFNVLIIARLVPEKQIDLLLKSFKEFCELKPDSALIVLGDGPLRSELEVMAFKLGIGENVKFLGYVDNPYSYIRAADVSCLTSKYEGLPTVVIESIYLNTPVITTRNGAEELIDLLGLGMVVDSNSSSVCKGLIEIFESKFSGSIKLNRKMNDSEMENIFSIENVLSKLEYENAS
ncbi:glycosyltransferase [Vibrio cholerae]